jgi:hypothetical protein
VVQVNNYIKLVIRDVHPQRSGGGYEMQGKIREHVLEPVDTSAEGWEERARVVLLEMVGALNLAKRSGRDRVSVSLSALDPAPFRKLLPPGATLSRIGAIV